MGIIRLSSSMITLTLEEVNKYLPPELPCNKQGLIQHLKDYSWKEEQYLEKETVLKRLLKNKFKGKVVLKDKYIEIRPIYVSLTKTIDPFWRRLKGIYAKFFSLNRVFASSSH